MDSKVKVLEGRLRELERALDIEKRQAMESHRQISKRDRRIRELTVESETFKNKSKDLEATIGDMQSQLNIYRRKFDDAAEVATFNQNRFRKVHNLYLEECGKTVEFGEKLRRKKAVDENTSLFHQVV